MYDVHIVFNRSVEGYIVSIYRVKNILRCYVIGNTTRSFFLKLFDLLETAQMIDITLPRSIIPTVESDLLQLELK